MVGIYVGRKKGFQGDTESPGGQIGLRKTKLYGNDSTKNNLKF